MSSINSKSVYVILTTAPISPNALIDRVEDPSCGAVVCFSGNVRTYDHGKEVSSLTYEIHPKTQAILESVVHDVASRHEVDKVAVAHRYGDIPIGESAFIVAVASSHRGEAFAACTEMVDEVKKKIPIWKHQVFADGTDEWVNCA